MLMFDCHVTGVTTKQVAMTDLVAVKCCNHHETLVNGLFGFYQSFYGVDFELQTSIDNKRTFHAHRLILSVFLSTDKLIEHADQLTSDELDRLLEILYTGEAIIRKEQVEKFLRVAKDSNFQLLVNALESLSNDKGVAKLSSKFKNGQNRKRTVNISTEKVTPELSKVTNDAEDVIAENGAHGKRTVNISTEKVTPELSKVETNDAENAIAIDQIHELAAGRHSDSVSSNENRSGVESVKIDSKKISNTSRRRNGHPILTKVEENKLNCDICSASFTIAANLRRHVATFHRPTSKKPHKCDICLKTFARLDNAKRHAQIHANSERCKCGACFGTFRTSEELDLHSKSCRGSREGKKKSYPCQVCGKSFTKSYVLLVHTRRAHTSERPYQCEKCGKTFTCSSDHSRHQQTHGQERFHMCHICGAAFSRRRVLLRHGLTHSALKPYNCKECGRNFSQRASLIVHARSHTGERPFKCDVLNCGADFTYRQSLADHARIHRTDDKSLRCNICGKDFATRRGLREHSHFPDRCSSAHNCGVCGRTFGSYAGLSRHSRVHLLGNSHQCNRCGEKFDELNKLKAHGRTHSAGRPFQCHVCPKAFRQKMDLKFHLMIHTGDRPHACPVEGCGKAFIKRDKLKLHSLTHGGEKPFRCPCGKTFTTRQNFDRHSLTHVNVS